jgi:hypothetical protein
MKFCSKCGNSYEDNVKLCKDCNIELNTFIEYKIPLFDNEQNCIILEKVSIAQNLLLQYPERYFVVETGNYVFNVKIDGEWNGVPIGKKIMEKNNQLKKKVAGYEKEQRNIRQEVNKQLKQKMIKQYNKY